mgnify:CR=1 FL=1
MVLHKNLLELDDNLHVPKSHTHVEAHITDLDKYTQAEVDALIAAITADLDDYLPKAGGFVDRMTGPLYISPGIENGIRVALSGGGGYGNLIYYDDAYSAWRTLVGSGGQPMVLQGSETRPRYGQSPAAQGVELALLSDISGVSDPTAIHWDAADEFSNAALMLAPADADTFLMEDASAGYVKRQVTLATLRNTFLPFGDCLPLAGGTMIGDIRFTHGSGVQISDIGGTQRNAVDIPPASPNMYFGDSTLGMRLQGVETRPQYNGTDLALLTDVMTPAPHGHFYEDTTVEAVTNGDPLNPEVVFDIDGDVVTIETTEVKVTYG